MFYFICDTFAVSGVLCDIITIELYLLDYFHITEMTVFSSIYTQHFKESSRELLDTII